MGRGVNPGACRKRAVVNLTLPWVSSNRGGDHQESSGLVENAQQLPFGHVILDDAMLQLTAEPDPVSGGLGDCAKSRRSACLFSAHQPDPC